MEQIESIYNIFYTYWQNFVGDSGVDYVNVMLTVIVSCSAITLGYLLLRGLFTLFVRGKHRFFITDFVFIGVLACYIIRSFFPSIFTPSPSNYIITPESGIEVSVNEEA